MVHKRLKMQRGLVLSTTLLVLSVALPGCAKKTCKTDSDCKGDDTACIQGKCVDISKRSGPTVQTAPAPERPPEPGGLFHVWYQSERLKIPYKSSSKLGKP